MSEQIDQATMRALAAMDEVKTGIEDLDSFTDHGILAMSSMAKALHHLENLDNAKPVTMEAIRLVIKSWKDVTEQALFEVLDLTEEQIRELEDADPGH